MDKEFGEWEIEENGNFEWEKKKLPGLTKELSNMYCLKWMK